MWFDRGYLLPSVVAVASFLGSLCSPGHADIVEGSQRLSDSLRVWELEGNVVLDESDPTPLPGVEVVFVDSLSWRHVFPELVEDKFPSSLIERVTPDGSSALFVEDTLLDSLWLLDGMIVPGVSGRSEDEMLRAYIRDRAAELRSTSHRAIPDTSENPEAVVSVSFVGRDIEYFTFPNRLWAKVRHKLGRNLLCYAFVTDVFRTIDHVEVKWAFFMRSPNSEMQHYMEIFDRLKQIEPVRVDTIAVRFVPGVRTDNVAGWFSSSDSVETSSDQKVRIEIEN